MAVTSIRLNENEEKVLNYLKDYYHCDASTVLKRSLIELYEEMKDNEIVENFEKKIKKSKPEFISAEDILK